MAKFEDFMRELQKAIDSQDTKQSNTKKKKKEEDESVIEYIHRTILQEDDDIAPTVGGGGRFFGDAAEKVKSKEKEIDTKAREREHGGSSVGFSEEALKQRAKEKEEEKKDLFGLDLFQKGALGKIDLGREFRDGYQFGDVLKTGVDTSLNISKAILGTAGDVGINLLKGAGNQIEGVADAIAYPVADILQSDFVNDKLGLDTFGYAAGVKGRADQNMVEDFFAPVDKAAEKLSVFGETTDAGAQGLGQVGLDTAIGVASGGLGLAPKGVNILTKALQATSAFGHGMSEARNDGANDDEAYWYGMLSAGAEYIGEKLFDNAFQTAKSVGVDTGGWLNLDDAIAKKVGKLISSPTWKNVAMGAVKGVGEGIEEGVTGFLQAGAKAVTYMKPENLEEFGKILADEKLFEQFFVGMLTGEMVQSVDVIKANKSGRDLITGLNADEQTVVDKMVEEEIAKAEKDGKKVKKGDIEADISEKLEKGFISVDDIERILGGDSYNAYASAKEKFMSTDLFKELHNAGVEDQKLNDEFEALKGIKREDSTLGDDIRIGEIQKRKEELKARSEELRAQLKPGIDNLNSMLGKVRNEVSERVKDGKLAESYRELVRSTQKFQADPSKYKSEAAKKTIQNLVDGGIANNTNEFREFAELMAKISDDKGAVFDITDNKRLKGTRFAVKGATTNAFVTEDGNITINKDSKKRLNALVGHEITHVLEGTEFYTELQEAVKKYAQTKGEWDSRLKSVTDLYKKYKPNADPTKELTADLIGEYIFNDRDFVMNLSTSKNAFRKVFDEVKYLAKIATAGSREARQLEKAKKVFEEVWKSTTKKPTKTEHSISEDLTAEQQEYFKDSVVRDESGNLKVMYHGTSRGGFNVFDTYGGNHGLFGVGSYFTDSKTVGESYTKKGKGTNPQVYEAYLNIKNPIDMDAQANPEEWQNAFEDVDFPESGTNEQFYRAVEEFYADQYMSKWEVADIIQSTLESGMGYDGITHIGGGRVNADGERHRVYIAFNPEQIKNIDNQNPTTDPDIRYSISEDNRSTNEVDEFFDDSVTNKVLDNSAIDNENSLTQKQGVETNVKYGRIREEPSFGTENQNAQMENGRFDGGRDTGRTSQGSIDGQAYSRDAGEPQEIQAWRDLDSSVRKGIKKILKERINDPRNAEDIYYYLVASTGKSESEMTLYAYRKAVDKLAEDLYNAAMTENTTLFEHSWKFTGENTTKLRNAILGAVQANHDGAKFSLSEDSEATDQAYLDAVTNGDMATAQKMVDDVASEYINSLLLPNDGDEKGFKYHRGPTPTKTFKRYAVFNVSEDGFRAAYAGNKNATPVGVWLDSQNLESYMSDMVQFDDGTFASYIPGDTGAATKTKFSPERMEEYGLTGGQKWLMERGGKHSSDVPNFSQMNLRQNEKGEKVTSPKDGALPHNKLVFEIEYGISDDGDLTEYVRENGRMMKGKNQGLAKIGPNQYYDFKTNPNAVGNWGIGGTFRITRIVPHDEIVSVTNQYKADAIADAQRLYAEGEISKKDMEARIKSANAIQVQKWVGGYNPAEFGITEASMNDLVAKGSQMKLTDPVTYDDDGNVIPISERFNPEIKDIRYSLSEDAKLADKAIEYNKADMFVDDNIMSVAKELRAEVAAELRAMKDNGVAIPDDIKGNTAISNSSYDITEENTTICPRSLAAEAFVDAVSEYLGRPLSVEEQIYISQDLQGRSLTPECTYCYVATDRKAYRAFLGEYIKQRDAVLEKLEANPNADVSRSGELYKEFLGGRKDTNPMYSRFKMWVDAYQSGTPMIDGSHLANMDRLMGDINSEFGDALYPQIKDAMKYAQSASWAKKRVSYVAYDGHILKWKPDRIKKLNSHYGLRMYSFSDFHPAFVLENMQMITDASVRGLKMLGYTKDTDFVEIFAPTGMNINISTFGFESGGNVYPNEMIGANWQKAQDLRNKNPNVGITFVATSDSQVEWALKQDWVDVVIPYHLVRTGEAVANAFGYNNFTKESSDTKAEGWAKGKDKKYIAPTEHNNDKATYLAALAKNHLKPRFERFLDNPNYMKLVNECRQPASESKPVQPNFNRDAIMATLAKLKANGYYQPVGGSVDRMYEIAAQVAENMPGDLQSVDTSKAGWVKDLPVHHSISENGATDRSYGGYGVYGDKIGIRSTTGFDPLADIGPIGENVMPVAQNVQPGMTRAMAPTPATAADAEAAQGIYSISDNDAPPVMDAPMPDETVTPHDPFADKNIEDVGKRNVNAYMYDHPEVKTYFQQEANIMLGELRDTVKGERIYNEEGGWTGTSRHTSEDIAYLRDALGYTYAEIEKGLNAIVEGNGNENTAIIKKIEFILNDRLLKGYTDFRDGKYIPANTGYVGLMSRNTPAPVDMDSLIASGPPVEDVGPVADIPYAELDIPMAELDIPMAELDAPVKEEYEAIRPQPRKQPKMVETPAQDIGPVYGEKLVRVDSSPYGERRRWIDTSTQSDVVDGQILPEGLDQELIHYQPISNRKTLGNANAMLSNMGYEESVQYINGQFKNNKVKLDDIALGERLIQEAIKRGDTKTAGDLIMDISILGTELGQKVQALSIIKRLTPEGQLRMLQRTIERGKVKKDPAFDGVELKQEHKDNILKSRNKDGSYDQKKLNKAVEDAKQDLADQMKVTGMDVANAWRYLAMLGNPKTHLRNIVSNAAMSGTVAVKNAVARTAETVVDAGAKVFGKKINRTKTWRPATDDVVEFAKQTTIDMKDVIAGDSKYSDAESIKDLRKIFSKSWGGIGKVVDALSNFNSNAMEAEDSWFSRPAFRSALREYLTANGIRTNEDIQKNTKIVEQAKQYALEQSLIATFRQRSWLATKLNEMERRNVATQVALGSVIPFKKTPINVAKAGLNYSPVGFLKTLTYDASQVKKGNMEASELIDHLAQNFTGTALTLLGYALAQGGLLNGGGEDDKEGKYDYQLGEQSYSITIDGNTYSLNWLSPVAMPLFVGANMYEQLVEDKEWNGNVVVETLAKTLDPLSEMSFVSSLNDVLTSYGSGTEKIAGVLESGLQNYITQYVPTFTSQIAATMDDTKRSTKASKDSDFRFLEETLNQIKYKIPGFRQTLEPTLDIWGNEVKQNENLGIRAVENFIAPWSTRNGISTEVDEEIKRLYSRVGENGVLPGTPDGYIVYKNDKYNMSAKEYTAFKKAYGQLAYDTLEELFDTNTYRKATSREKAALVEDVYEYARDEAKRGILKGRGVEFTNATKDGKAYYKENAIVGAIENDMTPEEYTYSQENPEKYDFLTSNGISYKQFKGFDKDTKDAYDWAFDNQEKYQIAEVVYGDFPTYYERKKVMDEFDAKDEYGNTVNGLKKERIFDYINSLPLDDGEKMIMFKTYYKTNDDYNYEIIDYLNNRDDISYEEMNAILIELGFKIGADGRTVTWD